MTRSVFSPDQFVGWSFQELNLALDDIAAFSDLGAVLVPSLI